MSRKAEKLSYVVHILRYIDSAWCYETKQYVIMTRYRLKKHLAALNKGQKHFAWEICLGAPLPQDEPLHLLNRRTYMRYITHRLWKGHVNAQ